MALSIGELVGYIGLDASGFQDGLNDAWGALSDGKWATAAGAVGLAAGAALTAGLVGAIQTESAVAKMNASLGLTGEAAQRAGQIAGNLYSSAYGDSMEDVTAATEAVMSSIPGMMNASAAEVEGLTASVIDLATAFDVDVAEASQVAGALMRDGLAADGTEAMDLITAAMQQVPAGVRGEILPVMSEYSKHFAGLGFTGQEAMGLIVAASQDGAIGMDKAGDAVKEFQIRATDMSKSSGEAYAALGLDQETMTGQLLAGGETARGAFQTIVGAIQSMDDPVAQSQAALALFGTPLEDLSADQIPAFIDSLASAGDGFTGVEGSAQQLGETLNSTTAVQVEEFKRRALMAFQEMAAQALPYLQPLLDFLVQWAPVIAPVVTVLGALGAAFWVVSTAVSAVTTVLPILGAAFTFLTGPVGIAIAIVGALVAAVWAIVTNWTTISAWLQGAFSAFGAWWSTVWGGLVNGVVAAWAAILGAVQVAWNGVVSWLQGVGAVLSGWWSAYWGAWGAILSGAWSIITGALSAAWGGAVAAVQAIGAVLSGWWSGLWSGLASVASALWAAISGAVTGGFRLVLAGLQVVGSALSGWWSGLWGALRGAAAAVWSGISAAVTGAFRGALSGLQSIGAALSGWWSGLWGAVRGAAAAAWNAVASVLTGAFSRALSGLRGIGSALSSWWSGLWSAVRGLASSVWSAISSVVTGAFSRALSGLRGTGAALSGWWSGLWSAVRGVASSAWSAISSVVTGAFRGALAALRGIGSALSSWWSSMWATVRGAAASAWSAITGVIRNGFTAAYNVVRSIAANVVSTLASAWSSAISNVSGFITRFLGFFTALPGRITGALGNVGNLLTGAGRAILDGFLSGLKGAWRPVQEFVGGIAQWIKDNKGPLPYDRRLLTPAGEAIMQGLGRGLESQMGALGGTLSDITWMIENGIRPDLDMPGLSLSGRAPGAGLSAAEVADAFQVGLTSSEDGREYRLLVDGYEFRAYSEAVADDVLAERVEQTAQPIRQHAGAR